MRTYPVSMLMKIIKEVTEKASQIESWEDSKMSDILYDTFFTKYGNSKLTDKKFKEVLLTIVKNKAKSTEIQQFALQVGL